MKKFILDNKINISFFIIAFLCLTLFVGAENISFEKTLWLHDDGGDSATPQMSWFFFKNDVWRFPIGSNPNYGLELASSIVFADSIPILTLIFKIFRSLLPENFQYISLWYFLCFYLQLFFSFKILNKFSSSNLFSFVGSLFFLVTPIFTWTIHYIPALVGQWILILTLYLALENI